MNISGALRVLMGKAETRPIVHVHKAAKRNFDAGMVDRLTADWTTGPQSINNELYHNLRSMRARSRDLAKNNEYGKAFFNLITSNVIGPSAIGFQSRAMRPNGELDEFDNAAIEERYAAWSKRGQCDVTRQMSRTMFERMYVLNLARDGEVIVRKNVGYANDQGYALEFINPDLLDIDHNEQPRNGRGRIVMGVELDDFWSPIGYWFLTQHPNPFITDTRSTERVFVPADQIIHAYIPEEPLQVRGFPWMHAGMRALRQLGGYREAAVVASRVGASKNGFWESPDAQGAPIDGTDANGFAIDDVEPGQFGQVAAGTTLHSWDPTYPHEQFETFNKAMLRGLSGAWGVAYFSLNNDLESVNFSSAKVGQANERDMYRFVQHFTLESLHDSYWPEWLSVQIPQMGLPMSRFDKFNSPSWQPRTWASPDPLKDAQTNKINLDENLTSPQRVITAMGHDPDEILSEIEQWNNRLREMGIQATGQENETQEAGEENDDEA